jgi:SOS-response transcriptional repressor LexA
MKIMQSFVIGMCVVQQAMGAVAARPQQVLFAPNTYMVMNGTSSGVPVLVSIRAGDGGPATQTVLAPTRMPYSFFTHITASQYALRIKATRNLMDTNFIKPEVAVLVQQQQLVGKSFISFELNAAGEVVLVVS